MTTTTHLRATTIALAAALLLAMASCRSNRHLAGNDDATPPADTRENPAETATGPDDTTPTGLDAIASTTFDTYCANFSCTIEGVAVNGQIRMLRDSAIWISVNKFVEVGRLLLTPSRARAYVKINNSYFDGSYADIGNRWGVDIDFATLQALLLANRPPACSPSGEPLRAGDTVTLRYSQDTPNANTQRSLTITKTLSSQRIASLEAVSHAPRQTLRLAYHTDATTAGQQTPAAIDVSLRCQRANIDTRLKLDKITLNTPLSIPFKTPSTAKPL